MKEYQGGRGLRSETTILRAVGPQSDDYETAGKQASTQWARGGLHTVTFSLPTQEGQ